MSNKYIVYGVLSNVFAYIHYTQIDYIDSARIYHIKSHKTTKKCSENVEFLLISRLDYILHMATAKLSEKHEEKAFSSSASPTSKAV